MPYTDDALAMAECHYRLGDYGKGDDIVENLLERSAEWIAWYKSLELTGKPVSRHQRDSWLRTMQHALITADKFKRTELIDKHIKDYECQKQ